MAPACGRDHHSIGRVRPPQLQMRELSEAPRCELQPGFGSLVACVGQ